jgi:signal transduction histidine kinase
MIQKIEALRIARRLLNGEHYLLVGREYMGKSLLVRAVVEEIQAQNHSDVQVVLTDFAKSKDTGWFKLVAEALLGSSAGRLNTESFINLVKQWHSTQRAKRRLVFVFDHVDRLARNALWDFSEQCSSLVHELAADPELDTSLLWCGEEVAMDSAFKHADAFRRRTHEFRAVPHTLHEVGIILDACGAKFHLHFSDIDKLRMFELTGGAPALVRHVPMSYTKSVIETASLTPLLSDAKEAISSGIDVFLRKMLADKDQFVSGPHDSYPAYVVRRIEQDERLLNLVTEMVLCRKSESKFYLQDYSRYDEDLLVRDADGSVRFRGELLQQFIARVFNLHRLQLAFFFLNEDNASLGKAQFCADLQLRQQAGTPPFRIELSAQQEHRVLSHTARRFHAAKTEEDLHDCLCFVVKLLGWSKMVLLSCSDDRLEFVSGVSLAGTETPFMMDGIIQGQIPYVIDAARRDHHIHWDDRERLAAAPLSVDGKVRFILCLEIVAPSIFNGEKSGYDPLASMLASLQTVVAMAEGPLGSMMTQKRTKRELAEKDRELATLRGIRPLRAELREPLNAIMRNILAVFGRMGLCTRVVLSAPEFTSCWARASRNAPPSLTDAQMKDLFHEGQTCRWVDESTGWAVLALRYCGTLLGRIEFRPRVSAKSKQPSLDMLKLLADQYSAHLHQVIEAARSCIYRFVFHKMTSGVQVMDRKFNLLAINKSLLKIMRERDGIQDDWQGKKCYEVHRPPGQKMPCEICTTKKAWEAGTEADSLEQWDSPKFKERKRLCHYVESTPLLHGNKIIGAVEISRPPTVGEVFAEVSEGLLNATGRLAVMKILAKACLMLGFDRCRFYWNDPFTGLITPQIMTIPGEKEPVEMHNESIDLHKHNNGSAAFERMCRSLCPCLVRRREWRHESAITPTRILRQNVFHLVSFPFADELGHDSVGELLMAPFVWQRRALGFLSADYKLLNRPMNDEDVKRLREFTDVATQYILTAERAEKNVNLVAMLAHQTNQPYDTIMANASEMMRCNSVKQRKEFLEIIRSTVRTSAVAFETQTRYLRELTRPEGPKDLSNIAARDKYNTTIESLFNQTIGMFGALCRSREIVLTQQVDQSCTKITLWINKTLFLEALINLLQNAVDALPQKLPSNCQKNIQLRATRDRDGVYLDVSDNGVGIPLEIWETVFEPYFSLSGKGFGVGLTVVKRNIVAHRCNVELIAPHSGFSTTFRITIAKEVIR